MNTRTKASVKTFGKYLFWTAVSAVVVAAGSSLGNLNLPPVIVPLVAAALKSIATFAATEAEQ